MSRSASVSARSKRIRDWHRRAASSSHHRAVNYGRPRKRIGYEQEKSCPHHRQRPDGPEGKFEIHRRIAIRSLEHVLVNQTLQTLWTKHSDDEARQRQLTANVQGLIGIAPRDELEGMIAAQLLAAHNAAMECYRRAMICDQTFEGRREALSQANKLSRTYAVLLDALNHHRGKGQQKVTVEHVHVHAGGQAVVGTIETRGVGMTRNQGINPMQSKLPMHLSPRCGARTRSENRCRSPAMPNGRCRMHGGLSPGAPITGTRSSMAATRQRLLHGGERLQNWCAR